MPADDRAGQTLRLVAARETGVEYSLEEGGDVFFILTNADGAKDFKIMQTPVGAPEKANWEEVVPTSPAG
jgi:oligopeptidase B